MKNYLKKSALIYISIFVVVFLLCLIFSKSFALFSYTKQGESVNHISVKGINIIFTDPNSEALNLVNVSPTTDSDGLNGTPFSFQLDNTNPNAIEYVLKVENGLDRQNNCYLDPQETQPCPKLSTDYIRYSYKIGALNYSTPQNLGANNNIIYSGTIEGNATIPVSILLWLDIDAPNSVQNNYFYGKLVLQGRKAS